MHENLGTMGPVFRRRHQPRRPPPAKIRPRQSCTRDWTGNIYGTKEPVHFAVNTIGEEEWGAEMSIKSE
jgi:hypothetical protein